MDKYRDITALPLIESKISHILSRIRANLSIGSIVTQQQLARMYSDFAARVYSGAEEPLYDTPTIQAGYPLSPTELNSWFTNTFYEIQYILKAVQGTSSLAESNFNFAVSYLRNLQAELKTAAKQLSVYSLYTSEFGDALQHGDTFINAENLDLGSRFLAGEECSVNYAEGTISLPLLEQNTWPIDIISVGSRSNGVLGNNVEVGVPVRGNIRSLFDGNIDTWTEYERIVNAEDSVGLELELKISLDSIHPINNIVIHPVYLGARTPPVLKVVEVSENGRDWISLIGDVRVAEFLGENEEERYHLAPHSSKFEGEFNITFAPRFVKFVRLQIIQSSTFPIVDVYGRRQLRYAIGIKEIAVKGNTYATSGELISKSINFSRDFTVASIQHLVDPPFITREVGGAQHFLSFDDGSSWAELTSQEEAIQDIAEILETEPTSSLRYKVRLFKNESLFARVAESRRNRVTEVFPWSDRRPFIINLTHKPVSGTVTVCDPNIGSRGFIYPKTYIGSGVYSQLVENTAGSGKERHGNAELRLKLPFQIKDPRELSVYVNNTKWTRVSDVSEMTSYYHKVYMLDRNEDDTSIWEVIFGNNDAESPAGNIPSSTDKVSVFLSEESIALEGIESPYKVRLDYPTDGDKNNVEIRFRNSEVQGPVTIALPSGLNRIETGYENLYVNIALTPAAHVAVRVENSSGYMGHAKTIVGTGIAGTEFALYRQFVDGSSELSGAGDWTVDLRSGIFYTKNVIRSSHTAYAMFYWEDVKYLTQDDWDFSQGSNQEIEIRDSGYFTSDGSYTSLFTSLKQVDLDNTGIVSKSVRVPEIFGTYKPYEIPYIDGRTEFESATRIQDEEVPESVAAGATPIASFRLTHATELISSGGFTFSTNGSPSDQFLIEVANYASLSSEGDFYIDVDGSSILGLGYVYVVLALAGSTIDEGTVVSYQYQDLSSEERLRGSYSVDYINGKVYFAMATTSAIDSITFKYTPYFIRYRIAEILELGSDFNVDSENSRITIQNSADLSLGRNLNVSYLYEPEDLNIRDLAPYFSPLLRGLAIRVT